MVAEREKYTDLVIVHFVSPMDLFILQREIPSTIRFTIGQLADRALILNLPEWANKYPLHKLAEMVNYHPRLLEGKIKQLAGNGQNPASF
jgi:hypothetical protein